jgi:hypothetical protein
VQKLTVLLTEAEKTVIENELRRVFALQDIPLGNDKRGYFLEELERSGLPAGALIQGLRDLAKSDVSSIKIGTIIDASRKHLERAEFLSEGCRLCLRGEVFMRDEQRREYSLACVCERGAHAAQIHGLARWDGNDVMTRRGRMLTLIPRIYIGPMPEVVA